MKKMGGKAEILKKNLSLKVERHTQSCDELLIQSRQSGVAVEKHFAEDELQEKDAKKHYSKR